MDSRRDRLISRVLRFCSIFLRLRIAEFLFGTLVFTNLLAIYRDRRYTGLEDDDPISQVIMSAVGAHFMHYFIFQYLLFAFVVFAVVDFFFRLSPRNLPYLNSITYAVHSFPVIMFATRGRPPIEVLVALVLIVAFNFVAGSLLVRGDNN